MFKLLSVYLPAFINVYLWISFCSKRANYNSYYETD